MPPTIAAPRIVGTATLYEADMCALGLDRNMQRMVEGAGVAALIEAPSDLVQVQRQVLPADMVELAVDRALHQRPKVPSIVLVCVEP